MFIKPAQLLSKLGVRVALHICQVWKETVSPVWSNETFLLKRTSVCNPSAAVMYTQLAIYAAKYS